MLDLSHIAGFDWDQGNNRKSLDKHNVSQLEAEQVFLDPKLLVLTDMKHGEEETRYHAYGRTAAGRLLQVSFTMRRNAALVRVISARSMSRKERFRYEQEA
jgi:uncharacterized DUF497 family protein